MNGQLSCDDSLQPTGYKASLGFIMNTTAEEYAAVTTCQLLDESSELSKFELPLDEITPAAPSKRVRGRKGRPLSYEEKRRARECRVDGCENYIINRGLCFRHGGGKKCSVDGCQSSAKNAGLCWRHGGSQKCLVEDCDRRGKSRGLCWAHGGGTKCSTAHCTKVAVSRGSCWAHGGGKRCIYDGCKKAAFERTHNYCEKHHEQFKDGAVTLEV